MAADAWDNSCIALEVSVDPSRKAIKMVYNILFYLQSLISAFTDQRTDFSISWNSQNNGC